MNRPCTTVFALGRPERGRSSTCWVCWYMFHCQLITDFEILRSEMELYGKSVSSWCDGSSDQSFMVDSLRYLSFQPVLHDWCNKGRGMCYPVCEMMHTKEPLLLIGKSSPCGGSRFPFSLIGLLPYVRRHIAVNKM